MQFPRTVFKDGGELDRAGGKYSALLAVNETQFEAALAAGWYATLPEAIDPPKKIEKKTEPDHEVGHPPPPSQMGHPPPTREEMETKARELGIMFDGRIGDKKLLILIEKAMGA